jgi:hypothetical protein
VSSAPAVRFGPQQTVALQPLYLTDPVKLDIHVYRGDTGRFRININDATGHAVDITGVTFDIDIRERVDDPVPIGQFQWARSAGGGVNQVELQLSAATSTNLPAIAYYDVQMSQPGVPLPVITTILAGTILTQSDVSRTP